MEIGFIAAIGSFIGSLAPAIGPVVAGFAKSAFSIISKLPIPGLSVTDMVSLAAKAIHAVVEILEINSEEEPEILGAKAEQSDKSLEDFDNNVEKYIKYLNEEIELDKERYDRMSSEQKLGCRVVGMSLETKAIEEHIGGVYISPDCLATLTKLQYAGINIDYKQLVSVVEAMKKAGITNLGDLTEFLEGKGESDRLKTGEALAQALGENADDKILEYQDAARKYEED